MKTILYIAQTKDGFIADEKGIISFLDEYSGKDTDYGYHEFYDSLTHTITGNTTYKQILTFNCPFPYPKTKNFVYSNKDKGKNKNIEFTNKDPKILLKSLPKDSRIWIVGGSKIIDSFLQEDLIDSIILFTMPTLLKKGIPLFKNKSPLTNFTLEKTKTYQNNVLEEIYTKI